MFVFDTEMHLVTFIFILLEFGLLCFQLPHYYARPGDKGRLWYLVLIVLLIIYNITGGLFPDPEIEWIPLRGQNIIAYGSGFLMCCYFPWYFYKGFNISRLRFHALYGVPLFLVLPYFVFFVVVYAIDGNLDFAVKYGLLIPFVYALVILHAMLTAIRQKFIHRRHAGYPAGHLEVIALYCAVFPWVFLAVVTYFNMEQWIEALVTNLGFVFVTILLMMRWVISARVEHDQHRRLMILDFNLSAAVENYQLTLREKEVAVWFCKGLTYKEIAEKLVISEKTVNTHLQNIYAKIDVRNRVELLHKLGFGLNTHTSFKKLSNIKSVIMKQGELYMLVDRLLETLHAMVPISATYRYQLRPLMHYQECQHKQELLVPPGHALFAWYILSGVVIAMEPDGHGIEQVIRIYSTGELFSDLKSFLDGSPSTLRLVAIGTVELLYIRRHDYKSSMESLDENHQLVRFYQFNEQEIERERTRIMTMSDEDKFDRFAQVYPMDMLPNVIGASFLKMTEPRYSMAKAAYNKRILRKNRKNT